MKTMSNNQTLYTRNKTRSSKLSNHLVDSVFSFSILTLRHLQCYRTPKELHKWITIMLDAYHLNKEETEIREAKKINQPIVIQRLFILKETIEEEYLEQKPKKEANVNSEDEWGHSRSSFQRFVTFSLIHQYMLLRKWTGTHTSYLHPTHLHCVNPLLVLLKQATSHMESSSFARHYVFLSAKICCVIAFPVYVYLWIFSWLL